MGFLVFHLSIILLYRIRSLSLHGLGDPVGKPTLPITPLKSIL